ncbi:CBS domain-containing protein [Paraburkholderia sp. LEh10]|uniref:CBS domain-containing protein n=1 Tax=Paraburkholderia sp. LEh10 TaxID=2821353 RepID=UPI001AE19C63|nr:CBS domain-containing protein [Paraburkholderia sp. LEh10]MBP0589911.1 CBS domain-containing protein [Paraburkholderia sp. LEh10]
MGVMLDLGKIHRWLRAAFRRNAPRARLQRPDAVASQNRTDHSRLGELTKSWHEQANHDDWSRLTCEKVMHSPFVVTPETLVPAALELLEFNSMHAFPVVDSDQYLVGMVTREQLTAAWEQYLATSRTDLQCVSEIMVTDVSAVLDTDTLGTAFLLLLNERSACLTVLDWRSHVVGTLAESDILEVARPPVPVSCRVSPPSTHG